ncbi:nucleotidyltransferase domain-containing protein [Desulfothermus okinawensis JCM 13304]
MKERLFYLNKKERDKIQIVLKESLIDIDKIIFCYIYGSFVSEMPFRDIDIGIYLRPEIENNSILIDLDIGNYIENIIVDKLKEKGPGYIPIDIKILNQAPVTFSYHVIKGTLLFSRNEDIRVGWTVWVVTRYLDLKPIRYKALKEAMTSWK